MEEIHLDIKPMIQNYCDLFQTEPVYPLLRCVPNINAAHAALKPHQAAARPEMFSKRNDSNGRMIPPDTLDGEFTILLNSNYVARQIEQDSAAWMGTVAHEITHIVDFMEYAKIVGVNSYDDLQVIADHAMFLLWTEFNAKSKGYLFYRLCAAGDISDDLAARGILEYELPGQDEILRANYIVESDEYYQAYWLANYLGRLRRLQLLYPQTFSDSFVKEKFADYEWVYRWYILLSRYERVADEIACFDEMKQVLPYWFAE